MKKLALAAILTAGLLSGCETREPTATNVRLSQESIASATVGKKPGALERAHYHMMR